MRAAGAHAALQPGAGGLRTLLPCETVPRRRPRFQSAEVIVILVVTVAVFAYQSSLGLMARDAFDDRFGAVPIVMWEAWRYARAHGVDHDAVMAALPLLTANFLHADVMHIAANMLFFWIFANVVSQVTGRTLFLLLYLLAGVIAVLVFVRTNPEGEVPMVGASGAIAGLEGAYFVFFYRWELPPASVWPLDGPQPPGRLGLVALISFAIDSQSFFGHSRSTVAYGAHVGGFVGGGLLAMIIATFYRPRFRV
jgi:membrane associated rhomboid family serine protease